MYQLKMWQKCSLISLLVAFFLMPGALSQNNRGQNPSTRGSRQSEPKMNDKIYYHIFGKKDASNMGLAYPKWKNPDAADTLDKDTLGKLMMKIALLNKMAEESGSTNAPWNFKQQHAETRLEESLTGHLSEEEKLRLYDILRTLLTR